MNAFTLLCEHFHITISACSHYYVNTFTLLCQPAQSGHCARTCAVIHYIIYGPRARMVRAKRKSRGAKRNFPNAKRKKRYAKTQESECGNAGIGMQKRKLRYAETQKRGGEEKRNRIAPKKTAILFLMSYPAEFEAPSGGCTILVFALYLVCLYQTKRIVFRHYGGDTLRVVHCHLGDVVFRFFLCVLKLVAKQSCAGKTVTSPVAERSEAA